MNEHPRIINRPHLGREEVGATPAGANFTWTPPARTHVEIISVFLELTTNATVTTRRVRLVIGGVADDDVMIIATGVQPANQVWRYHFVRGQGSTSGAPAIDGWCSAWPMGLLFQNPEQLRSDITNLQAGDQITLHTIRYQMWQDPVII